MGGLVVQTAPASEPVTTAEAKSHLRVETTANDTTIAAMVQAAREQCEAYVGRAFVQRTYDYYLDAFPYGLDVLPYGEVALPYPPLVSVTSITYYDAGGTLTTLAASAYQVSTVTLPGRLIPGVTSWWPVAQVARLNAVIIRYVAGYGAAGAADGGLSAIPAAFKHAVKMLVGSFYENREEFVTGTIVSDLPIAAKHLLNPYRTPAVLVAA